MLIAEREQQFTPAMNSKQEEVAGGEKKTQTFSHLEFLLGTKKLNIFFSKQLIMTTNSYTTKH